jgi:hypothetical protein
MAESMDSKYKKEIEKILTAVINSVGDIHEKVNTVSWSKDKEVKRMTTLVDEAISKLNSTAELTEATTKILLEEINSKLQEALAIVEENEIQNKERVKQVVDTFKAETPESIKIKVESLKGDRRIDRKAIKGLTNLIDQKALDRAIGILDRRTTYLLNKTQETISNIVSEVEWADILNKPTEFPPEAHTHTESDITDLDKYTQSQVDTLLTGKQNTLGFTPENTVNKENTTIDTNTSKYPTVNLLKTGLDLKADKSGALTQFVGNTAHRVFYSDASGDVTELALGADGTFLKSNGVTSAPSFATPAGSGDVSKVGTPVDNQIGVWTGDGTLEGTAGLTFLDDEIVVEGEDAAIVLDNETNNVVLTARDNTDDLQFGIANIGGVTSAIISAATKDGNLTIYELPSRAGSTGTFAMTDEIPDVSGYQVILSEGAFVDGDKTKLNGIETGAEVNTIDTVSDTAEIDLTITARDLTATIVAGSIDESKLDASVNASLDLADSALQSANISDTAYDATTWNGVTTVAPSKNAVRDKIETMDSAIALNTAKVTNATHSGDMTGDTALTAQPALITGKSTATVATGDLVLIADINDSNNLKQVTAQSIADLATGGISDGDKGDITVSASGATWTIDNDAVTYAKIQNVVADNVLLGNNAGAGGVVDELTASEVRTILNVEDGADVTDTTNVTSAGALMDSEVTNLSGIKTLTVPDNTTISTFGASIIDDADEATFKATVNLEIGTDVQAYNAGLTKKDFVFTFDGAGVALTTAVSPARVRVPANMTVNGWDIVSYDETGALLSGAIVVDILSSSTLGGSFSSIASTEKPTLSGVSSNSDDTLGAFSTSLTAGHYLMAKVDSVSTCEKVVITLKCTLS